MALNTFGWTPSEVTTDSAGNVISGVTLTVFTDVTKANQVTGLFDKDGTTPLASGVVVSDNKGRFGFKASDAFSMLYVYDGSTADPWPIAAHEALDAGMASHAQAVADAQAAADSAAASANLVGAPADTAIATAVNGAGTQTRGALDGRYAAAAEVDVSKYATPQAAVDAAQALGVSAVVRFGKGTFTTTAPITVTASDITLDMGRARIITNHSGAAIRFDGTSGVRLARVGVIGGRLDLNGTGQTGVQFSYCDGARADRVSIANGTGVSGVGVGVNFCTDAFVRGVRAEGLGSGVSATTSPRTVVQGGIFKSMQRDGVTIYSQSNDSTVSGVLVSGYNLAGENGRAGVHLYGSDRSSVTGCTIDSGAVGGTDDSPKIRFRDSLDFACTGNTCSGIKGGGIAVIALSDIGNGAGKGTITGNTIRDVSAFGVQVALGTGGNAASLYPVTIAGNTIIGVRQSGTNAGIGISVAAGADAATIASNYLEDLDGEAVWTACKVTVTGNTVRNIGKGTLGSKAGIYITASTGVVVGNYCFDDQGVPTMANGLRVLAGATARCAGNLFQNATSAGVRNDGTLEAQLGEIASGKIGFYGTAPIVKPTATPVAAVDAATTQALVNDIRTKLIALGLIA